MFEVPYAQWCAFLRSSYYADVKAGNLRLGQAYFRFMPTNCPTSSHEEDFLYNADNEAAFKILTAAITYS